MHACLDKFRLGRGGIRTSVADQVYTLSKAHASPCAKLVASNIVGATK